MLLFAWGKFSPSLHNYNQRMLCIYCRYYRASGVSPDPPKSCCPAGCVMVPGQYRGGPALPAISPAGSVCGKDGKAQIVPGGSVGLQQCPGCPTGWGVSVPTGHPSCQRQGRVIWFIVSVLDKAVPWLPYWAGCISAHWASLLSKAR